MKRAWIWIAGTLAVIAAGILLYRFIANVPVDELAELIAQGGVRQLREPLRPRSGDVKVLIFAIDGVGVGEFNKAMRSGRAKHIGRLFGAETANGVFEHAYIVPETLSILPSTTMAAWTSIYTGQPPAQTGIPGNEWFVREERKFYAPAPVSITESVHTLEMLTDGLLGKAVRTPTLFESASVRSFVSLAPVYTGADLFTMPRPSAVAGLFLDVAKGVVNDTTVSRQLYSEVDQESVDTLITVLRKHGPPALQVVYFPGIDLYTHVASYPLRDQVRYMEEILDPAVGRVLEFYEKRKVLDSTFVIFIADHGHTPVQNDDRHSLGIAGEHEPTALIKGAGFRLRPFVLAPEEDDDYQAAVAYQGAMAYIYLADRSTCRSPGDVCDWKRPPRWKEDVLPVVQAFYRVNETGRPIPQLKGALDLIMAREPRPVDAAALPFEIYDGRRLVPIKDYLSRNPRPDLLRFAERMNGLAEGPYGHRAGDILLLARSGIQRPVEDRYYFSGLYHSWHGSPTTQDSEIPFVLASSAIPGERLREICNRVIGPAPSQLDLVPLVRELLSSEGTR